LPREEGPTTTGHSPALSGASARTAGGPQPTAAERPRFRAFIVSLGGELRRSDRATLIVLVLWSVAPLAALLARNALRGGAFPGSDGLFVGDHLQYLAWIRDSGEQVLASTKYELVPSDPVFLHPMFLVSGIVWKLGASLQVSYLLWKPVAVAVLFVGFAAYVRRLVSPDGWARPAALALALFFYAPAVAFLARTDLAGTRAHEIETLAHELFPAGFLWGTLPTAIAVGLMPLYLLGIERLLEPARRKPGRTARWYGLWTAAAGLAVSWLHPWQGGTLLLILVGLVVWSGPRQRRYLVLGGPALATLAPLLYYFVLSHVDPTWEAKSEIELPLFALWVVIVGLGPLVIPAVLGLRRGDLDLQERMLLLWPLAALAFYFQFSPSYPYHAFSGMTLPLAVLAVRGWHRHHLPAALGVLSVAALTLPGMALALNDYRKQAKAHNAPHFITDDEDRALRYLRESARPGGVLSSAYLGQAVPALTGRYTWVGHQTWTPDFLERAGEAEALFDGRLSQQDAQAFVRETGAAFLLSDCKRRADLEPVLDPLVAGAERIGCATVYRIWVR
jgi:hypothetical protein